MYMYSCSKNVYCAKNVFWQVWWWLHNAGFLQWLFCGYLYSYKGDRAGTGKFIHPLIRTYRYSCILVVLSLKSNYCMLASTVSYWESIRGASSLVCHSVWPTKFICEWGKPSLWFAILVVMKVYVLFLCCHRNYTKQETTRMSWQALQYHWSLTKQLLVVIIGEVSVYLCIACL